MAAGSGDTLSAAAPQLDFNIGTTAVSYSTLAGVLAGFAFLAITLTMTPRLSGSNPHPDTPRANSSLDGCLIMLLATFLAMSITSFSYAQVAGDGRIYRAATEELISALGFLVSGTLLLFAIGLLFDYHHAHIRDSQVAVRRGVVNFLLQAMIRVALPLFLLFIVAGTGDYQFAKYGPGSHVTALTVFGGALLLLTLVPAVFFRAAVALVGRWRHADLVRMSEAESWGEVLRRDRQLAKRALYLSLACTGLQSATAALAGDDYVPPPWLVGAFLAVVFLLVVGAMWTVLLRFHPWLAATQSQPEASPT